MWKSRCLCRCWRHVWFTSNIWSEWSGQLVTEIEDGSPLKLVYQGYIHFIFCPEHLVPYHHTVPLMYSLQSTPRHTSGLLHSRESVVQISFEPVLHWTGLQTLLHHQPLLLQSSGPHITPGSLLLLLHWVKEVMSMSIADPCVVTCFSSSRCIESYCLLLICPLPRQ